MFIADILKKMSYLQLRLISHKVIYSFAAFVNDFLSLFIIALNDSFYLKFKVLKALLTYLGRFLYYWHRCIFKWQLIRVYIKNSVNSYFSLMCAVLTTNIQALEHFILLLLVWLLKGRSYWTAYMRKVTNSIKIVKNIVYDSLHIFAYILKLLCNSCGNWPCL